MCYRIVQVENTHGLPPMFKNVDSTFIIHLEGNKKRLDNIKENLKHFWPTKNVYILFNKGYKRCKKADHIKIPPHDLVDAFIKCLKSSKGHVLVLEDDFFFSSLDGGPLETENIDEFINVHHDEDFVYFLGCIPYVQYPYDFTTYRTVVSSGCHACIYSSEYKRLLFDKLKEPGFQESIEDWDIYTNFNANKYAYYKPICFQLFPETENSKHWLDLFGGATFLKGVFRMCGLDKHHSPGYPLFYIASKIAFLLILFVFVYLLIIKR